MFRRNHKPRAQHGCVAHILEVVGAVTYAVIDVILSSLSHYVWIIWVAVSRAWSDRPVGLWRGGIRCAGVYITLAWPLLGHGCGFGSRRLERFVLLRRLCVFSWCFCALTFPREVLICWPAVLRSFRCYVAFRGLRPIILVFHQCVQLLFTLGLGSRSIKGTSPSFGGNSGYWEARVPFSWAIIAGDREATCFAGYGLTLSLVFFPTMGLTT